ncbi:hypothetical protein PIROE2DRAFT_13764 [Piromyces sp. E2]|nr:hypothetical protein PIROE2DRAFT_13764 [Piromyces sp. E2]|eukprot:OUM60456.1 hypothetical protein PIROE2DRAFT_13764 [Piromyces sp. E2]
MEEFNRLYKFITKEGIVQIISNEKNINDIKIKFQLLSEEDIEICLYLVAIDYNDIKSIIELNSYYLKEKENDILNNIYKRKLLDYERLKKVIYMFLKDDIRIKFTSDLILSIIERVDTNYSFFDACFTNNVEVIQLLIDYANNNNIVLNINEKDNYGDYPFFMACMIDNIKMVQLLIEYANINHIIFNVNEKDENGSYPLISIFINNNVEMFQLLIKYANENNIILELNDKDKYANYPLLLAIKKHKNVMMCQLLLKYANYNKIILNLSEYDIGNVSDIPDEIIELFIRYEKRIKIVYNNNSELLKRKNEMRVITTEETNFMEEINKYFRERIDNFTIYSNNTINRLFIKWLNENEINK